jgi:RNA polymerase sigma-70 factor (ECF subfamily)
MADQIPLAATKGGAFTTTRWSLVRQAVGEDDPDSRQALESLCKTYWPPVYAYVRRRGYDQETALDLTQGFFTQLLEKRALRAADPKRGKFRSFLLSSVKNYLSNEWDKQKAKKRGAGNVVFSLDDEESGSVRYPIEPVDKWTPEKNFERTWALTLLEQVLARLREEMRTAKSEEYFEQLKSCLIGEDLDDSYECIARNLGVTEGALRTRIYRMRQRFGELLYDEVQQTLDNTEPVQNEIRYLLTTLS